MVLGQKKYIYSYVNREAFATSLLLMLFVVAFAAGAGEAKPIPRSYAYYQSKAADTSIHNIAVAQNYADSMLLAAGIAQDSLSVAEAMKTKADLYVLDGQFPDAILWFHRALSIANQKGGKTLAVRIYNNLGGVYLKSAQFDKALSQYNKAYSLGRSSLPPLQKATIINNLGVIYRHLKQYDQSKIYLQEALDLNKQIENTLGISQAFNNLGILAQNMGDYELAHSYFIKAKKLGEEIERPQGVAYASANLASLYLDQQMAQKALPYLYKAHTIKLALHDKIGIFTTHSLLGKAWLQMDNPDSAAYHYKTASLYADTLENVTKKIEALIGVAEAYTLDKKSESLAPVYNLILNLKDSSFHQERAAQLAIVQAEFEMMRKEDTIQELTAENEEASDKLKAREFILLLSLLMVLLLVLFAFIYVRRFRSERRANQLLFLRHEEIKGQKEQIEQQHQIIRQQNMELQDANKLIEHYNTELQSVNEQLEDNIKDRTRALTDTYRKLSLHINNTPLAVLEWNRNLALVRWPEQAEKIFGYKAQKVLGRKADELPFMQDEKHQQFLNTLQQAPGVLNAQQTNFQQGLRQSNGSLIYIEWSHSVLTDEEGQVESVLSIANDVSLREKAYNDLSLINKELDTFIYKASHDLRGPIARMQGIINLGKLESSDPNAHLYFDLLGKVSGELHHLLMRLLMVHNIHQHLLCIETINFREFVEELLQSLPVQQKTQSFIFHNRIPANLLLESDRSLLNIILVNLIENSLNFAHNQNPYIIISAKVLAGNKLFFSVQDNGPGISEHLYEKVFDMFFQGSTKSTGVGLGLYMVRRAVRKLGGEVKLERFDGLTTFTVVLPASEMMRICPVSENRNVTAA